MSVTKVGTEMFNTCEVAMAFKVLYINECAFTACDTALSGLHSPLHIPSDNF